MSLFSGLELGGLTEAMPGYRLHRIEWLNWGTFDGAITSLELDGHNTLLTGDIGSGKSTIVDAITTLLLRADRISYNKAAGADTRERDLRSYVLGHWKAERNETTGRTRPVALRAEKSYSVLLAVFANLESDQEVTLAQVFWFAGAKEGQPQRCYIVHTGGRLSIAEHFTDFGSAVATLRKRLRQGGAEVVDSFPEYEKLYRRALGIPSAQAMELFHQTVSMKSVGDLNKFVRSHMLEPFNAAGSVRKLIGHFDDLTAAHDAVVKARTQLAKLAPLVQACDDRDAAVAHRGDLQRVRGVLRPVADRIKRTLLAAEVARLSSHLTRDQGLLGEVTRRLASMRSRQQALLQDRAGLGGGRLGQLESLLPLKGEERDRRAQAANRLNTALAEAGVDPVRSAAEVAPRLEQARARLVEVAEEESQLQAGRDDRENERRTVSADAKRLNEEIVSLQARRSNIPMDYIDLRDRICEATGLTEEDLPFAGELLQVKESERRWQGAAERVLRGFGLSLLVRETDYPDVSTWINDHHLGSRLVYLRVRDGARPRREARPDLPPDAEPLYDKLEISDTDLRGWMAAELSRRADHACVESMAQFRRIDKAVTLAGQVKAGSRHEKDDRRRIDDPSNYVLGWSNAQKLDALVSRAATVHSQLQSLAQQLRELGEALARCRRRSDALNRATTVTGPDEVDWWALVAEIAALESEKRQLESSSSQLQRITEQLAAVEQEIETADAERDTLNRTLGGLREQVTSCETELARLDEVLAGTAEPPMELVTAARARLGELHEPEACDRKAAAAVERLDEEIRTQDEKAGRFERAATRLMTAFRSDYPAETTELDDAIESAGEYRELQARLSTDDLPRFEAEFKEALNTETIREIGTFAGQLRRQQDTIRDRIAAINDSLAGIDYNAHEQTYISLDARDTPNVDVREFRSELRACTSDLTTGGDEQYSERKFEQVSKLIARFKGREGEAEHDKAWTKYVTDVRNWFKFIGSERYRADDTERESFSDSDGKSGGQKEKLAYTILAASLAYQFKLEQGAVDSRTFRFAVIDEAFGRGSDESTKFALRLFRELGLQLLIVTPLQKIPIIEPFVASVGFVDNISGSRSRLQSMTIDEYRDFRDRAAPAEEPSR